MCQELAISCRPDHRGRWTTWSAVHLLWSCLPLPWKEGAALPHSVQGKVTSLPVRLQHEMMGKDADYVAAWGFHETWPQTTQALCSQALESHGYFVISLACKTTPLYSLRATGTRLEI